MEKTHLNPIRGLKKAMHSLRTSIAEAPPRLRKVAFWVLSLGAVLITVLVVVIALGAGLRWLIRR